MRASACWLMVFSCSLATGLRAEETFLFQHENVLGTTLELRVLADDATVASRAETIALAEIDRLAGIFSTYDPQSEFTRWQTTAIELTPISSELSTLLAAADHWRTRTHGAFHPGAELISTLWRKTAARDRTPSAEERAFAIKALQAPPWDLDVGNQRARRIGQYPLSLNAIAKGDISDRVTMKVLQQPGVTGALVKIGGDLRIGGAWEQTVAIRDPQEIGDNVVPRLQVRLKDRALATSGNSFRGYDIAGQRYSHIVDPRTGLTAEHIRSASVIAPSAMDADALATACCVLSAAESLALMDDLPETACLLVDADGMRHVSRNWMAFTQGGSQLALISPDDAGNAQADVRPAKKPAAPAWNGGFELQIDFTLNQPEGAAYRRPYFACWVEDGAGASVRTIVLWVQSTGSGPRWIPDLHRWYRKDFQRRQTNAVNLVATVSEPTRKAGVYKLTWDGADDHGKLVPPGKYTLFLEANRERGTYQLMRREVTFADQPFQAKFEDNAEIKAAALDYRRRPAADQPRP